MSYRAVFIGEGEAQVFQFLFCRLAVFYSSSTIDTLANLLYFVLQTVGFLIGKSDRQRLLTFDGVDNGLCQFDSTFAAL